MSTLKTKPEKTDPKDFIAAVESDQKRRDAEKLLETMTRLTGEKPVMWGPSMIGFGSYHYKYDSGREGDWFLTGFSPRKANLSIYIMAGFSQYDELMGKLGKHKTGSSCLYVKKLEDIDIAVLEELIVLSVKYMKEQYESNQ
ncbi:MAG TPA: DUF1801 domain-containing protein [Cryomorphaceae bacterium]|nr:DUF1801 domain-containing protein [Cryomorphaceae bacterium]